MQSAARILLSCLTATFLSTPIFASPPTVPTPGTQTFLVAHPGVELLQQGEYPVAFYGATIASDSDRLTSARQFAANFMAANPDAFGVDGVTLVYDSEITIRKGKFTVFTYVQRIEGLPVHGSAVRLLMLLGKPTDKIAYVGMTLVQLPIGTLPTDVISAADAINVVANSSTYGHLTSFTDPLNAAKVVFQAADDSLHRVWRFKGSDDDEAYQFFVDTSSSDIVGVANMVVDAVVSGTVRGYKSDITTATGPLEEVDLGGIDVRLVTGVNPECPPGEGEDEEWIRAADDGSYSFDFPEGFPVQVASRLTGEWVTVFDSSVQPNGERIVECELVTTTPPGPVDLVYNEPPNNTENETFQVNTFLAVEATHDWFKNLQPTAVAIDDNLDCFVNLPDLSSCNAAFDEDRILVGQSVALECNSAAFPVFLSHEYGHNILTKLGLPSSGFFPQAPRGQFHEGYSDAITSLLWNTDCLGEGHFLPGHDLYRFADACIRDIDEVVSFSCCSVTPDGPCTEDPDLTFCVDSSECPAGNSCIVNAYEGLSNCGNGCNVLLGQDGCNFHHCFGLALAGSFWDLQKEIGCCADSAQALCSTQPDGITPCTQATATDDCINTGPVCKQLQELRCCSQTADGACVSPFTSCSDDTDCGGGESCVDRPTEELFADFTLITSAFLEQRVLLEVLAPE